MDRAFVTELRRIVGDSNVLDDALELLTYECDALPHLRETPAAVALPSSAVEVREIVRLCARAGVPFVARGQQSFHRYIAQPTRGHIGYP